MKKNNVFPVIISLVAVCIFYMIYSGALSPVYILALLGALCMAFGIYGVISIFIANANPENRTERSFSTPVMEIVLGALVLVIGMVEGMQMPLPDWFWTAAFVLILIIAIVWMFVKKRNK